ncbi:MAG: AEC family transporter [Candidatus Symbiothrix sp.]|jgi:predicted permease|nr:AEC family transporter [Candidatus Symbiothrix sp.]
MINFILIFFCVATGMAMSRLQLLPEGAHKSVNAWVLYAALPAFSLRFVPEIEWSANVLLPIFGSLLVWGGAWLFVQIYDRKKRLSMASRTALLVTCGLGNTAFLGFPMISAFYGESEIHHAVIFDQVTFILFATIGVITVLRSSAEKSKELNFMFVVKKVFRFPPFIGCLCALILPLFLDISVANPLFDKLIATMSPMALFSIGLQLKFGEMKHEWRLLSAGLLYKLILAPCLVLALAIVMQSGGNFAKISVFEAGMSSHITVSLLASQYNLNPRYCSLVVGLGIVFGFITSTVWYFVSQWAL